MFRCAQFHVFFSLSSCHALYHADNSPFAAADVTSALRPCGLRRTRAMWMATCVMYSFVSDGTLCTFGILCEEIWPCKKKTWSQHVMMTCGIIQHFCHCFHFVVATCAYDGMEFLACCHGAHICICLSAFLLCRNSIYRQYVPLQLHCVYNGIRR